MTDEQQTREQTYFEPSQGEEADADAIQQREAATMDARQPAGPRRRVGEGTAGGYFGVKTQAEAQQALTYFAGFCRDCQLEQTCPGEACAIYRAEGEARQVLKDTAVYAGVPQLETIA